MSTYLLPYRPGQRANAAFVPPCITGCGGQGNIAAWGFLRATRMSTSSLAIVLATAIG
jgi:hypothetical protein